MSAKQVFVSWRYIISEMHLRQLGFTFSISEQFSTNKERIQNFKEIGDSRHISKPNQTEHTFNMLFWRKIYKFLKIYLEEQLLINYYVIKHLVLLKSQIMMDIGMDLHQGFTNFLRKSPLLWVKIKHLIFLLIQGQKLTNQKHTISRRITETNYYKILKMSSILFL